jgi:ammonia channel protein AmtB
MQVGVVSVLSLTPMLSLTLMQVGVVPVLSLTPMLSLTLMQVGVVPVHLCAGVAGVVLVGFFAMDPKNPIQPGWPVHHTYAGIFHGGNGTLLGVQLLGTLFHCAWSGGEKLLNFGSPA